MTEPVLPPVVFPEPRSLADAVARAVRDVAASAIARQGRFRLALPGGRTPGLLLAALASPSLASSIDWSRTELWLTDERALPRGDTERNDTQIEQRLLTPLGDRAPRLHRIAADAPDLEAAADAYAALLSEPLDLVILGVGEDGHIASLFPGSPLLDEHSRRAAAVLDSPKPPARRITLTPRTLAEAHSRLVLATGRGKHEALARALAPVGEVSQTPARLVRGDGWMIDAEAALGGTPGV